MLELPLYLYLLFFAVAFIYSSVGHGGASGYLAILALTGFLTPQLVPVVLILNIIVSSTAFFNYSKEGYFRWNLFWPFALGSIPAAFMGGWLQMEAEIFYMLVGIVLLSMAGVIVFRVIYNITFDEIKKVKIPVALFSGAGIGFLSGLIGVGGGIFLTPFMLFMKWGKIRQIAAVSALFILVNSTSGLIGHALTTDILWVGALQLAAPVLIGGISGSLLGVKTKKPNIIKVMLAIVLTVAGIKMLII
ncbi:MAG: sulfite exporter TauE/SafE family protein [Gracilimonas sp.]